MHKIKASPFSDYLCVKEIKSDNDLYILWPYCVAEELKAARLRPAVVCGQGCGITVVLQWCQIILGFPFFSL